MLTSPLLEQAWVPRPAGSFILHGSREDHATRSEAEPILALWSWTGDISFESYSMDEAAMAPPAMPPTASMPLA
ncbi:MAG: hypothetical protein CME00_03080 [Geminicoccus sp.]|nr:hypothetical protein [Geminicoccus sp.]